VAFGAEINPRFAGSFPMGHPVTQTQELYAKLVMEKTNNRVNVEVYPAGQLFADKDMVRILPSGGVDIGTVGGVQFSGLVKMMTFVELPLFYKDFSHVHRVLDSEWGDFVSQEFEKKGNTKVLYWADFETVNFASKNAPEDNGGSKRQENKSYRGNHS
jgi:TRAP-type C4-dicarboxylate transport system substrate-binding protein